MKKSLLQVTLEKLRERNWAHAHIGSYSGRNMMGRECLSISLVRSIKAVELGAYVISTVVQDAAEGGTDLGELLIQLGDTRWDDMGHDVIYYWPEVPYVEGRS